MVWIRVVALIFLTAYSYSMGQIPPEGLNGFGKVSAFSFFIWAPCLYLLPLYEAVSRKHPNALGVSLLNIFLGWTLLGWLGALIWAISSRPPPEPAQEVPATPYGALERSTAESQVSPVEQSRPSAHVAFPAARATKRCSFCAEDVMVEAIKCKHCGSALSP